MYPIRIIDNTNKIEKNLAKDWLRLITGADWGNDRIHVDAKTYDIDHGKHRTDVRDCGLALCLVRIGEAHNIFPT